MRILRQTEYGIEILTTAGYIITYLNNTPSDTKDLIKKLINFSDEHDKLMIQLEDIKKKHT